MKKAPLIAGGLALSLATFLVVHTQLTQPVVISPAPAEQDAAKQELSASIARPMEEKTQAIDMAAPAATPAAPPPPAAFLAAPQHPEAQSKGLAKRKELMAQPSMKSADMAGGATSALMVSPGSLPAPGAMMQRLAEAKKSGSDYRNSVVADDMRAYNYHDEGRDTFAHKDINPVRHTKEEPVSTFSIDVDTSSYSFMRASLNQNTIPQKDAVRVEEMVNYFPYDYTLPASKEEPFKPAVEVYPTPWNTGTKIVHIGIKGYDLPKTEKPHANLVFLIDTSGSMNEPNKLPLLQNSMKLLLETLSPDDSISIVTYAGNAGVALSPTRVKDKAQIFGVIDGLRSGGGTAGAEGIRTAYQLARQNFDKEGVNRVILGTDGDFNIGVTNPDELKSMIERERDSGIFLSVLGFGTGNYNDAMMQTLAQNGNGNAAYIDNLSEARKALVEEAGSTLFHHRQGRQDSGGVQPGPCVGIPPDRL